MVLKWVFFSELMLLGFISLLLTAISSTIANICVSSSFYDNRFVPCSRSEIIEEHDSTISSVKRTRLTRSPFFHSLRRRLVGIGETTCSEVFYQTHFVIYSLYHVIEINKPKIYTVFKRHNIIYLTGT